MDWRIGSHGFDERHVIDAGCEIREEVRYPLSAFPVLLELPARLDNSSLIAMSTAAEGFNVHRFSIHSDHVRFVVECVDVAGAAVHVQEDDGLGFGRVMRLSCLQRIFPWRSVGAILLGLEKTVLIQH